MQGSGCCFTARTNYASLLFPCEWAFTAADDSPSCGTDEPTRARQTLLHHIAPAVLGCVASCTRASPGRARGLRGGSAGVQWPALGKGSTAVRSTLGDRKASADGSRELGTIPHFFGDCYHVNMCVFMKYRHRMEMPPDAQLPGVHTCTHTWGPATCPAPRAILYSVAHRSFRTALAGRWCLGFHLQMGKCRFS